MKKEYKVFLTIIFIIWLITIIAITLMIKGR